MHRVTDVQAALLAPRRRAKVRKWLCPGQHCAFLTHSLTSSYDVRCSRPAPKHVTTRPCVLQEPRVPVGVPRPHCVPAPYRGRLSALPWASQRLTVGVSWSYCVSRPHHERLSASRWASHGLTVSHSLTASHHLTVGVSRPHCVYRAQGSLGVREGLRADGRVGLRTGCASGSPFALPLRRLPRS